MRKHLLKLPENLRFRTASHCRERCMWSVLWCTSKQVSSLHRENWRGIATKDSEREMQTHSRELGWLCRGVCTECRGWTRMHPVLGSGAGTGEIGLLTARSSCVQCLQNGENWRQWGRCFWSCQTWQLREQVKECASYSSSKAFTWWEELFKSWVLVGHWPVICVKLTPVIMHLFFLLPILKYWFWTQLSGIYLSVNDGAVRQVSPQSYKLL